jgi:Acyltransferase family
MPNIKASELEHRRTHEGSVGSNTTPSATCAVAPHSFVTASVTVGPRSGGRRRQLDGLRAIAFFAVFYNHAGGHIIWGQLGVRCFFALSGFLICGLLLDDDRPAGAVLRTFYWRRALRIFPLYYLALGLIWLAHGLPCPWWHLAYGSNIVQYVSRETNNVPHFWTLAIEEQFYAVFPLLLMAGRRRPGMTIAGALVASKAARVLLAIKDQSNWMDLLPHIGGETLLWGALAAVALRRFPDLATKRWWWLVFGGASLVTMWSLVRGVDFLELPIWSRSLDATPDGIGWASLAMVRSDLELVCAPAVLEAARRCRCDFLRPLCLSPSSHPRRPRERLAAASADRSRPFVGGYRMAVCSAVHVRDGVAVLALPRGAGAAVARTRDR